MLKNQKNNENSSTKIAGRSYQVDDYEGSNELSAGLAETHEQVSDTLTEGTIDQNKDLHQEG
ncbi:YozQ family protein [Bacillus timonensis]|nr:YozQ family protein [Bacillus timonensis]